MRWCANTRRGRSDAFMPPLARGRLWTELAGLIVASAAPTIEQPFPLPVAYHRRCVDSRLADVIFPFGRQSNPISPVKRPLSTPHVTDAPRMFPRFLESRVREILTDTPVLGLIGPRQSGKTTLAKQVSEPDHRYLTLDDPNLLAAARADPVGFIRDVDRVVIEEIQRAPDLMLAIKQSVDSDRRPGRFLLTGSANILTAPRMQESMAGRIETVTLLPLAYSERFAKHAATSPVRGQFLDHAFGGTLEGARAHDIPAHADAILGARLVDVVLSGGYPEAIARTSDRRRRDWFRAYARAVVERDLPDIAVIARGAQLPQFLEALALLNGQLVNLSDLGARIGVDRKTAERYLSLLEQLFIVERLPAWSRSSLQRLVKTPKLHFVDSGLAAALRGSTAESINLDRTALGPLLEAAVLSELRKQAGWFDGPLRFSHYRDKDGVEVDVVLENDRGQLVGIEIKASATVSTADFSGLNRLRRATKEFACGCVLYDGTQTLAFGDGLYAVPISRLWLG